MRGRPFPSEALFNREQSLDFGSPVPNGAPVSTEVIVPLDPALGGPSSAPAYYSPVNGVNGPEIRSFGEGGPLQQFPFPPSYALDQYAQGPQGDPFAPQPLPPMYYPDPNINSMLDNQGQVNQKPMKRKRKPRREKNCGFCEGDDSMNRKGIPELMVTCSDCRRSGHPTCMGLDDIGDTVRDYEWKCIECKTCEICNEKGDDERILFCDNCDRGWHTYCLNPPLPENPEGEWFCPLCTPPEISNTPNSALPSASESLPIMEHIPDAHNVQPMIDPTLQSETNLGIDPALREQSVASSSFVSEPRQPRGRGRPRKNEKDRKGKAKALPRVIDTDEDDVEVEVEVEHEGDGNISPSKNRTTNNRRRANIRPRRRSESVVDDVEAPSPPLRPPKRSKITVISPSPPPRQRSTNSRRPKIRLRLPSSKGKGREEEEEEEPRRGLFDDVLDEKQRDTSRTTILNADKERFEKARIVAESKLIPPPPSEPIDLFSNSSSSTGRFPLRSAIHQLQQQHQSLLSAPRTASPTPSTPTPNSRAEPQTLRIRTIRFGPFDIQTWYDAPFPEEFTNIPEGRIWICEFCLKYMKSRFGAHRHRLKCKCRHPPGDEIYRDGSISIFEVDGRRNKIYCQNLCLLSKMFLDHKSLFYDVEPFLFYVMTEVDDIGAHFVGYFSKEKKSSKDLNLSCIMTLPVRQRQGWGNLLIDFSYLLSRKEHRSGTPERPLSALGAIGYKKYWTLALMRYLSNAPANPRLEDISIATGMTLEDIYITLVQQNMISIYEEENAMARPSPGRSIKIIRKKTASTRKNIQKTLPKNDDKTDNTPFVPPTNYSIDWDRSKVEQYMEEWNSKGYLVLKPEKLKWTPFFLSREDKLMPPLGNALADMQVDIEATPIAETRENTIPVAEGNNSHSNIEDDGMAVDGAEQTKGVFSKADVTESMVTDNSMSSKSKLRQEQEQCATEDESSPSFSPPPLPIRKPQSSNRLEALAALACVVQKANPVDSRRKQTNAILNDRGSPKFDENVNGVPPSKSIRPIDTHSRQSSEKGSDMPSHTPDGSRQSISQIHPSRGLDNQMLVPRNPTLHMDESLDKDAEYAAQLAREEGLGRRSLRSSSNSTSATPTLTAREFRSKDISRKRRKASPISGRTPPTMVSPDRPTTRRQAQALAFENARASRLTRRQSSKLAENAVSNEALLTSPAGVRFSKRNGISKASAIPSPSKPSKSTRSRVNGGSRSKNSKKYQRRYLSPSVRSESTSEAQIIFNGSISDVNAEGESDIDAEGEPDNGSMDEIDESMDILCANLSIGSQGMDAAKDSQSGDSTVYSPLVYGVGQITIGNGFGNGDAKPVTEVLPNGIRAIVPGNGMVLNADNEEEDIDAEGEPDDEDADGEPDPDIITT